MRPVIYYKNNYVFSKKSKDCFSSDELDSMYKMVFRQDGFLKWQEKLKNDLNKTLILVSHDMDFVYEYADDVVLLNEGKVAYQNDVVSFFNSEEIINYDIEIPKIVNLYTKVTNTKPTIRYDFESLIKVIEEKLDNVK